MRQTGVGRASPAKSLIVQRPSQCDALGLEETLGNSCFRREQIKPVKCARDNFHRAWNAALFESIGIFEAHRISFPS